MVDDQIDEIAPPAEIVPCLAVVGLHERPQERRPAPLLPLLDQRLVQGSDIVVMDQRVAQADLPSPGYRHAARPERQIGDDLVHHRRAVHRINPQSIPDFVGEARILEEKTDVVRLFFPALVQIEIPQNRSRKRILL